MIRLLVGLGNPGPDYEHTRHNAGFWWLEAAALALKASFQPDKGHQARVARTQIGGRPLWLLAPQTYMNLSGRAVASLARFYKIEPADILVVHDELDLPAGETKLKFGGGHAGHNGLRDIHAQLGTGDYWRLRLGIGHPGDRAEVVHWVLKKPSPEDRQAIEAGIARSVQALPDLLAGDTARATLQIHTTRPPRPKPPRPPAARPEAPPPPSAPETRP
ncbi:MAG: aminoacyl-tRNA hydrolase [Rhodoferax sp.]|nr:aminoacyl-tRNA hydrolase [Rhodoferax sp.]